jgi:hypothetical protein
MKDATRSSNRLDISALEIILALLMITLPDLLLSNSVSLPFTLRNSPLAQLKYWVNAVSSLEIVVPVILFIAMLFFWLTRRNSLGRQIAIVYLCWVTFRLIIKIVLIIFIITSRPQTVVGVLIKDTFVLWIINFFLFGTWFWIIDAGGPRARRDGTSHRYDFAFPQRMLPMPGWENWQPRYWDYVFLAFSSNTQFGMGDTQVLSLRAKFLSMLQITLSMAVIVFMATFAISLLR